MLLPIPPNSTGPFGVQLRNSPCPAPRTNPGLAVKPDFLEISIRSLCDKSPFEAVCWLEADLVPDPEFCSANLPWTQFPGACGPSQELELGPNLLALGPAFLILTPVLPITDSFFFLCPALLQTGNRMNMTKWVNGVIWTASLCNSNPWMLYNHELPGTEPTAGSLLVRLSGQTSMTLPSFCPTIVLLP